MLVNNRPEKYAPVTVKRLGYTAHTRGVTISISCIPGLRETLREPVGGQILLHPAAAGVERFLTAELSGDYSGLVRLVCGTKINLVAVTRIERVTRGL
jgi:hypothetical protein